MKNLLKKYEEATTDEQVELFAETVKEIAGLKAQIQELSTAQETAKAENEEVLVAKEAELASIQTKVDEITVAKDEAQAELDRRDEEIKLAELASRKETLGDFAEGMEDADILDEVKYEMSLLKKENAELKAAAKNPETEEAKIAREEAAKLAKEEGSEGKEKIELSKGSRDKKADDELSEVRTRVLKRAYGE